MNEFQSRLQDDLKEALSPVMCSYCLGKCRRFEVDREPKSSRQCAGVIGYLLLRRETWADPSMAGLRISTGGWEDYDVTEWAGFQHVGISWIPTGVHITSQLALGYQVPVGRGPPQGPLLLTCRVS